jgi:hypothetical protein
MNSHIKDFKDHGWWLTSCDLEIIACFDMRRSNFPSSTWPLCISQLNTLTWYSIRHRGVVYDVVLQGTMITIKNHVVKSDLVNYDHHSHLEGHRLHHLSHLSCHALIWRIYESGSQRIGRGLEQFGDLMLRKRYCWAEGGSQGWDLYKPCDSYQTDLKFIQIYLM